MSPESQLHTGMNDFGDVSLGTAASIVDELYDYLQQQVENIKLPLQWWVHNQKAYPNLHQMALNYLSIPGRLCTIALTSITAHVLYTIATLTAVKHSGTQLL
jgi:hypothetical protein